MDFTALLKNKKLLGLAAAVALILAAKFLGVDVNALIDQAAALAAKVGLADAAPAAEAVAPAQ